MARPPPVPGRTRASGVAPRLRLGRDREHERLTAPRALVDVNAAVGPWPHGDCSGIDVRGLLEWMDRLGVDRGVVYSTIARAYDPATGNARLLEELAGQPRLDPCFVLAPLETGEFGEPSSLPDRLRADGVRAARVFPREHGWSLGGPEADALAAVLVRARIPLLVDLDQTTWEDVEALLGRHAELALVVCRTGYRELRRLMPLLDLYSGLCCDLSYFGAHDGVEEIVARFGPERLVFGTGLPVDEPAGALCRLTFSGLGAEELEAIAHGNAERLLGIDVTPGRTSGEGPVLAALRDGVRVPHLDVFDVHGHLGAWPAFWLPRPGADSLVAVLDRCGVAGIAVSSLLGIGPDAAAGNTSALEAVGRWPGRLYAWLVASPHRQQDEEALERDLARPDVVGLKIHPDTHVCPLDAPAYRWVFRLAERTGKPVLAHTFAGTPWSDPLLFDTVAASFPSVRAILAHAGVTPAGFRRAIDVCSRHPQLVVDTCGSYMTGEWIRRLVGELGAERVLYASDAPFIDLRYGLGRVLGAGLGEPDLGLVLGGNARRLLGLAPSLTVATA